MTLLACQIFSTIAHEGSFARTAEQLHLTPSSVMRFLPWRRNAVFHCLPAPKVALP